MSSEIKAVVGGKTYVGASFCPSDTETRDRYRNWDPAVCIDFNRAREDAQAGGVPEEVMEDFQDTGCPLPDVARVCLAKIAAGQCLRFPKEG